MIKKIFLSFLILLLVLFLGILIYHFFSNSDQVSSAYEIKEIEINEQVIEVEISDNDQKRVKGLSYRESLDENTGMLFIFDSPDRYGIWMKDMNILLDIIWFNENQKVIYFEENVRPETFPKVFKPEGNALYVLEVNAGFVKESNIKVGDMFVLE